MSGRSDLIDIACELLHETDKAYLISEDGGETKIWVPKSMSEFDHGILTLPEWLATEKGLL